jgi:hypothetical protein
MAELRYLAQRTLDEAISAFAAAGSAARIVARGTDLLVQMRAGVVRPGLIVDIKKIAEMTAIEETADGGFRIGAAEVPNPKHPQGVKGVGEVPLVPVTAAVANAIHNALGKRFYSLPMSPPKILAALEAT